ncbi:MAG: tetratricopeptide repeat protein, partial [Planctomycetota bacterium]|nr:tetratricopeptide repeat protein [Planctomycetota bacterium]
MNLRFALLLSLVFLSPVAAQDEDLPPDEVADLIDLYVERGGESLRQGSYDEAKLRFQKALEKSPGHRGARLGVVAADMAVGEYDKAMAQLEKLFADHPGDREGRVIKARIHLLRGKDASARETLREVLKTGGEGPDLVGLDARIVLAEALARRGKRDEARDVLDHFIKLYEDRREMLAEQAFNADRLRLDPAKGRPISREMTLIGRALRIYVELSPLDYNYADNAIELLGYAREIDPENWDAAIEYVRVFRVE